MNASSDGLGPEEYLAKVLKVLEHPEDLLRAIRAASDRDELLDEICGLLDVDQFVATLLLQMPAESLSSYRRSEVATKIAHMYEAGHSGSQ
ncbi:hypothetical protein [Nocardioides acrostichi]|uniref:Uncharacterized protein n=1 Tax=Nocardioides acrostichi TaxID=2784339 RepID=A0A930V4X0_9ACTN|nr:hypothetical protein [Nocardioides acrostichi]MBF4163907.1 hypothetical protein [Nocardioides acrostichi]